jgi:anti-sigma-K factor RskA
VTEEREHPIDDLAAYSLGGLEVPEARHVEHHLATCTACGTLLRQYQTVVGTLPLGLDPVEPPPEAWPAIRSNVQARRHPTHERLKVLAGWRRVMWPAMSALAGLLLIWNVVLQVELTRRPPGPEVEALARRPGRLVILTGTGTPEASGRLLVAIDGHHGHLAVAGLSPLPPHRVYQLWFIRPGPAPLSGGSFGVDAHGRAWASITVPVSLDETREIEITEEPSPGTVAPTGKPLLAAKAWR